MCKSYNPEKLAEAIKAFGKERLEELYKQDPQGRLAQDKMYTQQLTNPPKDVFEYYFVTNLKPSSNHVVIKVSGALTFKSESDFTYLEPPRPLKNGHTKEEMKESSKWGWRQALESADRNFAKSEGTFETWYTSTFPTATAPTEEKTEEPWRKAQEAVNDRSTKEMELVSDPQPQPSFTREELGVIKAFIDLRHSEDKLGPIGTSIRNKLTPPKPLPTRLDLLIKWWGEQERPSEIEFSKVDVLSDQQWVEKYPMEHHTHYRRGTSEWISLEGVV